MLAWTIMLYTVNSTALDIQYLLACCLIDVRPGRRKLVGDLLHAQGFSKFQLKLSYQGAEPGYLRVFRVLLLPTQEDKTLRQHEQWNQYYFAPRWQKSGEG